MDKKTYLASELSLLIGVPRTTINDWLSKYAAYIDCDSRGKRRVYNEDTVAVLKEIAALRAEGKNAFEIGVALEAKHGVRPELEHASLEDAPFEKSPTEETSAASSALALQDKSDAMALFEKQMQEWQRQITEAQEARLKSNRRGFAVLAVLIVLLFGAGGAAAVFFGFHAIEHLQQEKLQWEQRFQAMEQKRDQQEKRQQESVTRLEELLKLSEQSRQEQLLQQRKQFESELARLEKENRDRDVQEQMKLRGEFAAEQKKMLSTLNEEKQSTPAQPSPAKPAPAAEKEKKP